MGKSTFLQKIPAIIFEEYSFDSDNEIWYCVEDIERTDEAAFMPQFETGEYQVRKIIFEEIASLPNEHKVT